MISMRILPGLLFATVLPPGQIPARPKITGIAHVALKVHNFAASQSFHHGYLGYEEAFTLPKTGGSVGTAFIKINERHFIGLSPESEPRAVN